MLQHVLLHDSELIDGPVPEVDLLRPPAPFIITIEVPKAANTRLDVTGDPGVQQSQERCTITIIERPLQKLRDQYFRLSVGLAQNIEGYWSLEDQQVPQVPKGKLGETPARIAKKCALEVQMACLALLCKLKHGPSLVCYVFFMPHWPHCPDLEVDVIAEGLRALHDAVIGLEAIDFLLVLKGYSKITFKLQWQW